MNNKILITLLVIFTVVLSIGAVCASDVNEDFNEESVIDDSSSFIDEDNLLGVENNGMGEESEDFSFSDLNSTINSGNEVIDLTGDYVFNAETDGNLTKGIKITNNNIVINGNNHIIDAKNQNRIFYIYGKNITINNLILKNANDCAIVLYGGLNTKNVEFINCSSDTGGGIYTENACYVSENDKFIDNSASEFGAAIYSVESNTTVSNGSFKSYNDLHWSLIYAVNSNVTIINTTFANTSSKYATAINSVNNKIFIKKSKFINLFANRTAGAIAVKKSNNVTIEDCEFINVSSVKNGGAIFADVSNGSISIDHTLFENCLSEFGGAYLQLEGKLELTNSNFTNNYAEFNGGAVYLSNTIAYIENCIFKDNKVNTTYDDYPTYGGAVFSDLTNLTIFDSKFEDNSAVNGSAIYCYDSNFRFNNLELNGNANNAICTYFDKSYEIGYLNGTDSVYEDDLDNTYYPYVIEGVGMQLTLLNNTTVTELPSRYDLREENLVSPVKNQGYMGACWAFGMYGSLESVLLKAMNYSADFSENNMQNSMLVYSQYAFSELFGMKRTEGGFNVMSMAYLLSWLGAFPQDYDTYDEIGKISPLLRTDNDIHIQDIIMIRNTPGDSESIKTIKEAILKYGAISGFLQSKASADDGTPTKYYNENTYAEYIPEHLPLNHAIAIVGWDDDFSKDNFLIKPPADGAWIVKNSWGSNWADGGYFYVSYYDETLCANPDLVYSSFVVPIIDNTLPYNKNYQYDLSGFNGFYKNGTLTYSNNYESVDDDVIAAVGTYFDNEGVEYTVEIKVNNVSVYNQTGVSPYYGYHTIKLDKYISIKEGDNFTASITSTAVPLCEKSRVHYKEGSSIVVLNGTSLDLSMKGTVACLKVYTLEDDTIMVPVSDVSVEYSSGSYFSVKVVTADGHPVINAIVEFEIDDTLYEVTSNVDGIATFEIPKLNPGNYTLTITYNNQTINVTVKVNATNETNRTNATQSEIKNNVSAASSGIEMPRSGNPIIMMMLSVLAIVGLGFKRKDF